MGKKLPSSVGNQKNQGALDQFIRASFPYSIIQCMDEWKGFHCTSKLTHDLIMVWVLPVIKMQYILGVFLQLTDNQNPVCIQNWYRGIRKHSLLYGMIMVNCDCQYPLVLSQCAYISSMAWQMSQNFTSQHSSTFLEHTWLFTQGQQWEQAFQVMPLH